MPYHKCTTPRRILKAPKKPRLTFLVKLERLLADTPTVSRKDFKAATELLKSDFYAKQLRREGPCLLCKSPMRYGDPSTPHKSRGDAWLDKTLEACGKLREVRVSFPYQQPFKVEAVNGVKYDTITPYLCAFCRVKIRDRGEVVAAETKAAGKREMDRGHQWRVAVYRGEVQAHPADAFRILCQFTDDDDAEELRDMEYDDFLKSRYWEIVRRYVLHKRGALCELCAEQRMVHVHHRTYEHHGQEHLHIGDLVVLCDKCHATFHNKLGRGKKASEKAQVQA